MARMEIISGIERRRRWSDAAKLRILAEAEEPGVSLGDVARRHDIYPAQIRLWRKSFSPFDAAAAFVPVNIVDPGCVDPAESRGGRCRSTTKPPIIKISLRNGRALKAPADIDRRMLASLIQCVEAA